MALILIMGIPASGKSTFCRKIELQAPNLVQCTSFDEFITENAQPSARETRKQFERHVESTIHHSPTPIHLIEDVFYLQSMRRPFQRMAHRHHLQFGVVYLKVEVALAVSRNARRARREPEETIRMMAERMEEPVKALILESHEDVKSLAELMRQLEMTRIELKNSEVTEAPESSEVRKVIRAPKSSSLEKLDVISRRLVSEIKKENSNMDGKKLSEARKILMAKCRGIQDVETLKEELLKFYYDKTS